MEQVEEDSPRKVRIGVIGHIGTSQAQRISLLQSVLRNLSPEVDVEFISEDDPGLSKRTRDVLIQRQSRDIEIECSPYPSLRKSKGEKKRERAHNRRYYGRDFQ